MNKHLLMLVVVAWWWRGGGVVVAVWLFPVLYGFMLF
jgi:hypothetical protein